MVWTKGKESVYSIRVFQTSGKYRIVGVVRDRIKFALRNKLCRNLHHYICMIGPLAYWCKRSIEIGISTCNVPIL